MKDKKLKMLKDGIKKLIDPMGSGIASDKITIEGLPVGYMYREEPDFTTDSGWRFFSGTEDQEYADDSDNFLMYDVNTIANYDPSIIPYLHLSVGSELERDGSVFKLIQE